MAHCMAHYFVPHVTVVLQKFIKAVLNHEIWGALVFPAKTNHTEDVLEFISNKNLRKSLKLNDGDLVSVNIDE